MAVPALPLSRHPFIRTTDIDEARQVFAKFNTPIRSEVVDRRTPFSWQGNAVRVGAIHIGANAYGGSSLSRAEDGQDTYAMTFALSPVGGEGFDGKKQVIVKQGVMAWLSSPGTCAGYRYGTDYRGLNVTIPRAAMVDALAVLGGKPEREPLRFDSQMPLGEATGGALARLFQFAADEMNRDPRTFGAPLVAARFVDSILFSLLLGQPNNHRSALSGHAPDSGPRHVQQAAAYLATHAAEPIRMRDLTTLTGVSARALQAGFLKHRGCSPMDFLRSRRLELARAKLAASSDDSVADIARSCGFAHLGRFSTEYRACFGETPSATRAKGR